MRLFTPVRNPTAFRKIAISIWRRPNNPQVFGNIDVDYTKARDFIARYNARYNVRITPTHLVGRAIGMILAKFPEANAKISFSRFYQRNSADIYFNVLAADGRDLAGLKFSAADRLSIAELERDLRDRTRQIRLGRDRAFNRGRALFHGLPIPIMRFVLALYEFADNAFGFDLGWAGYPHDPFGGAIISSGGMGGLDTGYGALPPVARCPMFLVVMPVRDKPWIVDGEIEVRPILRICGTFDHRVLDGHLASLIAVELKELLNQPEKLLTEKEREELVLPSSDTVVPLPGKKPAVLSAVPSLARR
jgi:hypothetical protein